MKIKLIWALCVPWIVAVNGLAYAQSTRGTTQASEYSIGPEDVLQVQVWGRPDLTGAVAVDFAGKIQLPLVGSFQAEGYTPANLSRLLADRFQLMDPSIREVVIAVTQYNSRSVTVVGEVRNPGRYGFREMPDLWAVILVAGGATPGADLAGVQIVHEEQAENEPKTITVDLSGGIEEASREDLPQLQPKDTIIVPTATGPAAVGDRFQILGAVRAPGTYRISVASKVVEALSVSGGPLDNADLGRVRLTRATSTGAVTYELDLQGYLYEAKPIADLTLQAGDTVTIPSKRSFLMSVFQGIMQLAPVISVALSLTFALR